MDSVVPEFEVLPGLPPYGPLAVAFSATGQGTQREGFVVRFFPNEGESWVGNFQPGMTSLSTVEPHPDGQRVIVISGGQGYVIDLNYRNAVQYIGGQYECILRAGDLLILSTPIDIEAVGPEGQRWKTRRISWAGLEELEVRTD